MIRVVTLLSVLAVASTTSRADDQPAWKATLGDLVKAENAGFGGLCGMVVDPKEGTIWINISDRGFYRSDDQARTFHRISDRQPKGRTESPGCFQLDPTGASRRLVTALVYGSPISVSEDGGVIWKSLDAKSSHVDWFAVDWSGPDLNFILTLKHESGGLLLASLDGGRTFAEIGKGYGTGWVFDGKTAVVAQAKSKDRPRPDLMRTTDGCKTWQPCGAFSPVGANSAQALPKWHGGSLYWLVEDALIVSEDKGATWIKAANLKDGRYGPVFGKDAKQMFVLTGTGLIETIDGGVTWSKPISPPKDLKGVGGLTWLAYDPKNDVLYLMKMGSDLFKLPRRKSAS